jgi:hypothetical protein
VLGSLRHHVPNGWRLPQVSPVVCHLNAMLLADGILQRVDGLPVAQAVHGDVASRAG